MKSDHSSQTVPQLFDRAVGFLQRGSLAEAERPCQQILAIMPAHFQALQLLGAIRAQQGRNTEALALIGDALKINPFAASALLNYGNVLKSLGRDEECLAYCDRALAIEPNHAGALYNRGNALLRLKRLDEALASYDASLAIRPGHAEVLNNRGLVLHEMRRCEEALESYDGALAINPDYAQALNNRGASLYYLQRIAEALASYQKALALQPDYAEASNNYGIALRAMDRIEEALASFDRALAVKPDYAEAWHNRGNALRDLRRFAEALASYDGALGIDPGNAESLNNRGICLYFLERVDEALASYDKALAIKPDYADALHSRGMIRWKEGQRYAAAVLDLENALFINPDHAYARGDLLHMRMHGADWRGFEEQAALVDAGVRAGRRIIDPFMYLATAESAENSQKCSRIFAEHFHPPASMPWKKRERRPGKIRVGYVSGEFREQATAFLTAGLYECHDKAKFEIVAFDNGRSTDSAMRRRLEAAFDRFVPISTLSDRAAAEKIQDEDIDILVNLNGYFGNQRMGVFAQKPAPVQVNYLGFPGTLGAGYIDYILADRFVIPEDEKQYYAEKVVWLPGSYQVNDSRRYRTHAMPGRAENQLPETAFVFCNFNMSYKITPPMFAVWMRILKRVEGSVLWLLQSNTVSPGNLRHEAECHGVAGHRLVFAPFVPMEKQLDRLPMADLFLDSLPCNAHTTASDALWAGVPLLTCSGKTFASRVAASLLHAIGLPELVTANLEDYEGLAVKLAKDPAALRAIRQKLAGNRHTTSLFDTDLFRRHLEIAYTKMWEISQRGEAPRSFGVEPGF
jgi:predicted O-linked N-acetylglucosamine transferase (SPINDLY family)